MLTNQVLSQSIYSNNNNLAEMENNTQIEQVTVDKKYSNNENIFDDCKDGLDDTNDKNERDNSDNNNQKNNHSSSNDKSDNIENSNNNDKGELPEEDNNKDDDDGKNNKITSKEDDKNNEKTNKKCCSCQKSQLKKNQNLRKFKKLPNKYKKLSVHNRNLIKQEFKLEYFQNDNEIELCIKCFKKILNRTSNLIKVKETNDEVIHEEKYIGLSDDYYYYYD